MKLPILADDVEGGDFAEGGLDGLFLRFMCGDDDLRRLVGLVGLLLDEGGDAYLVAAEDGGNAGENAGAVGDGHAHVVARAQVVDGSKRESAASRPAQWLTVALREVVGGVEDVGDDGAGGGLRPGARALEEDAIQEVAFDLDGVEDAVDFGQRLVFGQQDGVDARLYGAVFLLADGEELDCVAHLAGVAEVLGAEVGDAFAIDLVGRDDGAEGEAGEDGDLVGGVDALHVVRGVGFGVAERLRAAQGIGEVAAFLAHGSQDVVRGAVDDGGDGSDVVGEEVALEGRDYGYAAADAGFVEDVDVVLAGGVEQLGAVLGHDLLVGGDDVASGLEGLAHEAESGVLAAEELDDDVELGREEVFGVAGDDGGVEAEAHGLFDILFEDANEGERAAKLLGEKGLLIEQDAGDGAADDADAHEANADGAMVGWLALQLALLLIRRFLPRPRDG